MIEHNQIQIPDEVFVIEAINITPVGVVELFNNGFEIQFDEKLKVLYFLGKKENE